MARLVLANASSDGRWSMFTPVILTIPALVLPLVISPTHDCQFGRLGDEQAVVEFDVAVGDYVRLHQRLEPAWPPPGFTADPEQVERAAQALRAAIRAARPQAVQGSLFSPAAAHVFRLRIANALRAQDDEMAAMVRQREAGAGEGDWTPAVHDAWPRGASGATWPMLHVLPPLPPELEYRVVGRDLVVLDVHAGLVVDVLEGALLAGASCAERFSAPPEEDFVGCAYEEAPASPPENESDHAKQ